MKTWSTNERLRSTDLNANFAEGISKATPQTVTAGHTWSASQTFSAGFTSTTASLSSTLTMTAAASKLVPGATSFSHRNNADSADNLLISDAGAVTVRAGLTVTAGGMTVTAGGLTVTAGTTAVQALTATSGAFGTTPASSGTIRIPYNGLINFRNAANTNDVTLALTLGSDDISMGIQANSIQLVTKLGLLSAATAGTGTDVYLGGTTQTTIGANGGASALTALPLGYLIAYKGATKIVIPYYNG